MTEDALAPTVARMAKAPSDVARRARDLLDKKAASELPDGDRVRKGAAGDSSAEAFFSALVEGAFLLAAADGELAEEEATTLGETIAFVTGEVMEPDDFMDMLDEFADALSLRGLDARLTALAAEVPDAAARKEVLAFAALIAFCDQNLADAEKATMSKMAAAFAIPQADVDALLTKVGASLALALRRGPDPASGSGGSRRAREGRGC